MKLICKHCGVTLVKSRLLTKLFNKQIYTCKQCNTVYEKLKITHLKEINIEV